MTLRTSLFLALALASAAAQAAPAGLTQSATPITRLPALLLSPLDAGAIKNAPRAKPLPLRFALPQVLQMRPAASEWETLPDGRLMWRKLVQSPDASSLSFAFGDYHMPQGGELYVYSLDGRDVRGPYTDVHNTSGQLWTALVRGREAVIEVTLPASRRDQLRLQLTQAHLGFVEFWNKAAADKSGSCNVDVACAEGDEWRDDIRAVARYTISGQYLCSGQLVNNTARDFTPYFLTANHCISSAAEAPSTVYYWNYQGSRCGAADGSLDQSQSGASLVATYSTSDFTLLKLDQKPAAAFQVFYAGWDNGLDAPTDGVVCIHHPSGDEKRISFSNHPTHVSSYGGSSAGDGTHLQVERWDIGTTEGGSSGSGLWNKSHRLVGQLHGGNAACDAPDASDWYGRLAVSWTGGGTAENSLQGALDPNKSGVQFLDGADPSALKNAALADKGLVPVARGRFGGSLAWISLLALGCGASLRRYSVSKRYLRSSPRNWW